MLSRRKFDRSLVILYSDIMVGNEPQNQPKPEIEVIWEFDPDADTEPLRRVFATLLAPDPNEQARNASNNGVQRPN